MPLSASSCPPASDRRSSEQPGTGSVRTRCPAQDLPLVAECKADLRLAVKEGNLARTESCLMRLASTKATVRVELADLDEEGLTVLHQAIFVPQGLALLKLLVRYGGDIGARDEEGCTLLHTAAMVSNMPIAGWLINEGANLAAFDREGHLPMDRCEDPLLQDVLFQAMARAGLVGLAMPTQQNWMDRDIRHEDLCDRAGDSDYGTGSSVGSLSEDEDRLSLHSTQSFSSVEEVCAGRESPVSDLVRSSGRCASIESTSVTLVDGLSSVAAGSDLPPACPRLVRVRETSALRLRGDVRVDHVRREDPSLQRRTVVVVRHCVVGLRHAETVFIAAPKSTASSNSSSSSDQECAAAAAPPAAAAVVSNVNLSGSGDDRSQTVVGHCGQDDAVAADNPIVPELCTQQTCNISSSVVNELRKEAHDVSQSSAAEPTVEIAVDLCQACDVAFSSRPESREQLVEDDYLEGSVCGSSSDETIRAAESDAESIGVDLISCASDEEQQLHRHSSSETIFQLVDLSLEAPQSVVCSQALASPQPQFSQDLPPCQPDTEYLKQVANRHERLVLSVSGLAQTVGGPPCGSTGEGSDDRQAIDDSPCQAECQAHLPEASTALCSDDDMAVEMSFQTHSLSKYPISPERRALEKSRLTAATDFTSSGKGKGISRRNTVSEVDMGWVAPRTARGRRPVPQSSKPLKSLLRRPSVAEYDRSSAESYSKVASSRKKSVSFPAEVMLADAIHDGDLEEVRHLLMSKAIAVDSLLDNGLRPLHSAVLERQREIVKLLLSHGAQVEQRDSDGWTALHAAATEGTVPVTHLLLENGADPWVKTLKEKKTAYELASNDNVRLVLSKAMGEAYRSIRLVPTALEYESEEDCSEVCEESEDDDDSPEDVYIRDSDVEDNSSHTDEEEEESDDDCSDESSPVDVPAAAQESARQQCASPSLPVATSAQPSSCSPTLTAASEDDSRLSVASSSSVTPIVSDSKSHGSDCTESTVGSLPLALVQAVAAGDVALTEKLILEAPSKEQLTEVDENGSTLLHVAARGGDVSVVEKLLDFGLKATARDAGGRFPLDVAVNESVRATLRKAMIRPSRRCYSTAI